MVTQPSAQSTQRAVHKQPCAANTQLAAHAQKSSPAPPRLPTMHIGDRLTWRPRLVFGAGPGPRKTKTRPENGQRLTSHRGRKDPEIKSACLFSRCASNRSTFVSLGESKLHGGAISGSALIPMLRSTLNGAAVTFRRLVSECNCCTI